MSRKWRRKKADPFDFPLGLARGFGKTGQALTGPLDRFGMTNSEGGRLGNRVADKECPGRATFAPKQNARGAQENLWPKSFLERPVARHFVCSFISIWRAVCKPFKMQAAARTCFVGIALGRERFTSGAGPKQRRGLTVVERAKRVELLRRLTAL